MYLHRLSTGDFGPALEQFLGSGAGLSATTITRLTSQLQEEARAFAARDLSGTDYVYLWVDGIHLKVRLDQEKLCLLVMLGVRADGRKEFVAITDGYQESTESWADLLRDCKRRGMTAPVLAVGDGALGFWHAVREVFPSTKEQRCWFHKQANVLAALPKSAHPSALAAIKDIYNAEDIDKAQVAVKAFEVDFGAKYPKAVAKITDDLDTLLEFYKYPAEQLGPLAHDKSDRKYLCRSAFEDESHQGPGITRGRTCHAVHHQPVAVLVELISELRHVRGNLGLECGGQHLAVSIADDLVQQRTAGLVAVGLRDIVNYREHGRAFPTSAPTPVLIEYLIP